MLCFFPWFAQPLKLNLRTNKKYEKKTQQISTLLCSLLVVVMLCVRLWLKSNQYVRGHWSVPFSVQRQFFFFSLWQHGSPIWDFL